MEIVDPVTDEKRLVYDWNFVGRRAAIERVEFDDETLRDGIQSPSVRSPSITEKTNLLYLMAELGIQSADIGLPGAGPRVKSDVIVLAREIAKQKLPIFPNCAARTVIADIEPIVEASQAAGIPIEASLFIGSSPLRQYVENWTLDRMLALTEESVKFAVKRGLPVMFVTEDTTRANPKTLRKLYTTAIECGARRICLADTVGHATPHGTRMLVRFMKRVVRDTGEEVEIDWHGHRDRALGLENAIAAAEAGAIRLHGTGLGIGERCGNTPMEHLLINFRLMEVIDNDLSRLGDYCELVSAACDVPIPFNHPVMGSDAYRTGTGVHAAAIIKAINRGHEWLADRVYSGVPARWTDRTQKIEIGPMSGASNVVYWLTSRGIEPEDDLVAQIFEEAKRATRLLTEAEVTAIVEAYRSEGKRAKTGNHPDGK
jgi:2-isopropylmalate synthase